MLQFDAAPVVPSNPYCVNGKEFLSRNREMLDDIRDRGREASLRAGRTLNAGVEPTSSSDVLEHLNET